MSLLGPVAGALNQLRPLSFQPEEKQMHTKDILAEALRDVGLDEMAKRASEGYYHDFLSPLPFPELELEEELRVARAKKVFGGKEWHAIEAVRRRLMNGDFDASLEESEAWMNGPEGQAALLHLAKGR